MNKIQAIKEIVSNETSRIIDMLRENEMKLINEAMQMETKLINHLGQYVMDENVMTTVNEEKACVQRNECDEQQLAELNLKTSLTKTILNELISQIDLTNESYEFGFNRHLDFKEPLIGEIKTSKKVKKLLSSYSFNRLFLFFKVKLFD